MKCGCNKFEMYRLAWIQSIYNLEISTKEESSVSFKLDKTQFFPINTSLPLPSFLVDRIHFIHYDDQTLSGLCYSINLFD